MLLNGEGKQATASTTSAQWAVSKTGANSLSVDVEGSDAVYCLVNCTTSEFDTLYAAGKAIKVRNGIPFAFYGDQFTNIKNVCYRVAAGGSDSDVNFGAY